MYILDTNTLIYFFKGMGGIEQRLLSVPPKDIGIPSIVIYELEYGIAKSSSPTKRREQLKALISIVNILPFGTVEAEYAAMIRATLEKQGTPIGPYDTLIAGTAMAISGILVTHNIKEFERITELKLEDWYSLSR